jgi:hypothetical protein
MPTSGQILLGRAALAVPLAALLAGLLAPRGSAATFFAIAALPIAAVMLLDGLRSLRDGPLTALGAMLLIFGIYIAANAGWSADRGEAFGKVLFYWLVLLAGTAAVRGTTRLDDRSLGRIGNGLVIGFIAGSAFLLFEVASEQWLKRTLIAIVPALRPAPKHIVVTDGTVTAVADYALNRNFAILVLVLWPVLLFVRHRLEGARSWLAAAALLGVSAAGVFMSAHETSMLALLFSSATFAGMALAPRVMRPLVIAGWVAATLLVVPLAMAAYAHGLHQAKWIPETGRNRIILWNVTVEDGSEAPVLGTGVASTKALDDEEAPKAKTLPGHTYPQKTGRHAHNIFLQTWYELGGIGAVLLLVTGLVALNLARRLPASIEPYAVATFVAATLIGASSWGMWQTWFMAAFGVAAMTLALAIAGARRTLSLNPR